MIFTLDQSITNLLNHAFIHNNIFDLIFSFFSLQGYSLIVWIIPLIFLFIKEGKEDKRFILYFFLIFAVTVVLNDFFLKYLFQRIRPINHSGFCPTDYSFPSTHAATAFASATTLSVFDKKRKLLYYFIAVLISYSRIYLGCHYFFDVSVGALAGLIISKTILFLCYNKDHHARAS